MSRTGIIGFGQYIPGHSLLHRLDPRTKLAVLSIMVISLFSTDIWWDYLVVGAVLCILIYLSKIPVGFLYRSLKSIWLIVAVTYLFHLIFTRHGDIMWSLGPITLYEGGVVDGAIWTIRIVLLAALASLITMTTPPLLLTRGLARLMSPLKRLKVPVDELALATSSALAFIPLLWREADQLIRAQRSRGAPFDRGPVWSRAKAYQSVLIPLFISAIRRAEAMAMAMEVRGYRGESGRTQFRPLKLKRSDYLILFLLLGYVLLLIFRGIG